MRVFVDWGTPNLRAWLVDDTGRVKRRFASEHGLLVASDIGFEKTFEQVLKGLDADPATPALLFGMVGSQKGWLEVPYVTTPADAGSIRFGLGWARPWSRA